MYVVLEYRSFGERQANADRLLKLQSEAAATKKTLLGYTKYADDLLAVKNLLADNARNSAARISREFTYVETIPMDATRLRAPVTVTVRYAVEGSFGMDLKPESFEVVGAATGVELRVKKPTLMGFPTAKPLSNELSQEGVLPNEPVTLHDIHQKLPALAQRQADAMAAEDTVLALCEKKLIELVRTFLAKQPGVRHLPSIVVVYK